MEPTVPIKRNGRWGIVPSTFLALFAAGWFLAVMVSFAQAGVIITDLENALMCKCDDKCGKVMINCTCDTAKQTREDFRRHLQSGLTVDQVVQIYVDKYGETVLSAPTKTGFNLVAWLTPFAALIGGGLGIRKLLQTWLRENQSTTANVADKKDSQEEPTLAAGRFSKQLQSELDRIEL